MTKAGLWWRVLIAALSSRSNRQFYDRISPFYDQVFVEHRQHAINIAKILSAAFAGRRNTTRVLDLGCGTGLLSRMLAGIDFDVTGVDISFESLRRLRQLEHEIPAINADAAELPIIDGGCQAVVSLGVWRHFPDPPQVIREIKRILASDGLLVIGYFPPAIGGAVHPGHGFWTRFLIRLYSFMTSRLGYVDRVDLSLERRTLSLTRKHFRQVSSIDSGECWHLLVARGPLTGFSQ